MEEKVIGEREEVTKGNTAGKGVEGGREKVGQGRRRKLQEHILTGMANYLLQNPQDQKRVVAFILVSLASYHFLERNLERLAQALDEDPLWASTLSALLLKSKGPLLSSRDTLEDRLRGARYRLAERLVGAGGGMALASRILSLDLRLFVPLMVAQKTLDDKGLVVLAQVVAFGGPGVLRKYGLEAAQRQNS